MRCHHLHGPVYPGRRLHVMCQLSFVLTPVSSVLWRLQHKHKALLGHCFRHEHMHCTSACVWPTRQVAEAMAQASFHASLPLGSETAAAGTHPQTQQHIQPPRTSLLPWQLKQAQQPTPELKAEAPAAASQAAEVANAADSQPVAVKAELVRSEEAQEEPTASDPHKQELMPEPEKLEPSGPVSFGFSKK